MARDEEIESERWKQSKFWNGIFRVGFFLGFRETKQVLEWWWVKTIWKAILQRLHTE